MRHPVETLAEVERRHILETLNLCGQNRTHAADMLGMSLRGLRMKLHQYEQEGFVIPPPIVGKHMTQGVELDRASRFTRHIR